MHLRDNGRDRTRRRTIPVPCVRSKAQLVEPISSQRWRTFVVYPRGLQTHSLAGRGVNLEQARLFCQDSSISRGSDLVQTHSSCAIRRFVLTQINATEIIQFHQAFL